MAQSELEKMLKEEKQLKILDLTYNIIHTKPWVKEGHWQPCPPNCFRVQGVDLKRNAYRVWMTNGVFHKQEFIPHDLLEGFLKREREHGAMLLDDTGIGLEVLLGEKKWWFVAS